jgi:hypothetical protein
MNSVFSAFKSNKNGPSALSPTASESNKRGHGAGKKTLNLNETNNYEKLRHIREKMSNMVHDDDEINLRKPPAIPITSMDVDDECEIIQKVGGFDCVDSAPLVNGYTNGNLSSSSSSSSLNTISLASIKKHYNQDNSENYASENNLLSKCCNGAATMGSASNVSIVDTSDVNSASATNLVSINSMPLSDANDASKSASSIFNKQPQPNNNNNTLSNTNRNRPRLSLSNVGNSTNTNQQQQPAVHGRNNGNGLPTGRTRLSTHQRNLSLDFR